MKLNRKRRGIPFFTDFYAFELLWDREPTFLAKEFLEYTKRVLLHDVALCVGSELRYVHSNKCEIHTVDIPYNIDSRPREYVRRVGGYYKYFQIAKHYFSKGRWAHNYGGDAWALICEKAMALASNKEVSHATLKIDNLIDSAHNCGYCLDKLYVDTKFFLDRKSTAQSSEWLVEKAQPYLRIQFGRHTKQPNPSLVG